MEYMDQTIFRNGCRSGMSVDLQLISYSWPDPSRHAIELVVFTINEEDGYSERIVEVY